MVKIKDFLIKILFILAFISGPTSFFSPEQSYPENVVDHALYRVS